MVSAPRSLWNEKMRQFRSDAWKDGTTLKAGDLHNAVKVAERTEAWIAQLLAD